LKKQKSYIETYYLKLQVLGGNPVHIRSIKKIVKIKKSDLNKKNLIFLISIKFF